MSFLSSIFGFNKKKFLEKKIESYIQKELQDIKFILDPITEEDEITRRCLSLSKFKAGSKDFIDMVSGNTYPINLLTKEHMKVIANALSRCCGIGSDNFYANKQMSLLWDITSILVCARIASVNIDINTIVDEKWFKSGEYFNVVSKNHSKEALRSICKFKTYSKYYDKAFRFLLKMD